MRLSQTLRLCGAIAIWAIVSHSAGAAEKPNFTVAWSVYAGFDPYPYMGSSGILTKWADKYGVSIKLRRFDYAASIDAFVAKNVDACAMTNMEALDMPAAAGLRSEEHT